MADPRNRGFELYQAAKKGDLEQVRALIVDKAPLDLQFNSNDRIELFSQTALFAATLNGHTLVAEALLKAGANPNILCTEKRTALHIAALKDYHEIIKLLLEHQADYEIKDNAGVTPLGYVKPQNSKALQLLLKAGAQVHHDKIQRTFIYNYNLFIEELKKYDSKQFSDLQPLSESGCCDGFSKTFLKFEYVGLPEQFDLYTGFFSGLSHQDIKNLAKLYADNPRGLKVNLLKNAGDPSAKHTILFDKIINDFILPINLIQKTQAQTRFSSIGANWDNTNMIASPTDQLEANLIKYNIIDKERYQFIGAAEHAMSLHILKNGARFYDPRYANGAQFCNNEKELAAALKNAIPSHDNTIIFTISNVSFSEIAEGKFTTDLEQILEDHTDLLKNNLEIQSLLERRTKGQISEYDAAYILLFKLTQQSLPQVNQLKNQLQDYLAAHPRKILIDVSDEIYNKNIATPLHFACLDGNFQLVHDILTNKKDVNLNNQNSADGYTPLHMAVYGNQVEIVEDLLAAGADISIKTHKGSTPMQMAVKINNQEIVQLLKSQAIVFGFESDSKMTATDQIAIKLYKFFDTIAHPAFLSKSWTVGQSHYRLIAKDIAANLKPHPEWNGNQCKQCINQVINAYIAKMANSDAKEDMRIFNGILRRAQFIIDQQQIPKQNIAAVKSN